MSIIDLSNVTQNATALYGVTKYTNDATSGVLMNGGLIAFFIIILLASRKFGVPFVDSLAVASWSMFVLSVFLFALQMVFGLLVFVFLGLAIIATVVLYAT